MNNLQCLRGLICDEVKKLNDVMVAVIAFLVGSKMLLNQSAGPRPRRYGLIC